MNETPKTRREAIRNVGRAVREASELEKPKTTIEIETYTTYGHAFDESNSCWDPRPEYNMAFLQAQASYLQHVLDTQGHLFLNEVYDNLGMERTPAGQVMGWLRKDGSIAIDVKGPRADGSMWVSWTVQGVIVNDI